MPYLQATDPESQQHKKNIQEINKHAQKGGKSVLALTADWCGHCKHLKPIFDKVGKKFKGGSIMVANVDQKMHHELKMQPSQTDGFPTIRAYNGLSTGGGDYDGPRNEKGLTDFINKQLSNEGSIQSGGKKRSTKQKKELIKIKHRKKNETRQTKHAEDELLRKLNDDLIKNVEDELIRNNL